MIAWAILVYSCFRLSVCDALPPPSQSARRAARMGHEPDAPTTYMPSATSPWPRDPGAAPDVGRPFAFAGDDLGETNPITGQRMRHTPRDFERASPRGMKDYKMSDTVR